MIYSEEDMRKELAEAQHKPVAFAAHRTYPYWELDDRVFEVLLYQVFSEDIRTGHFKDQYDACTLMTGVGEQGRDVKLLRGTKNAGVVQGKRIQGLYGRPAAAKEIIKFCLFAILYRSLIADETHFDYWLAVANGFNGPAIKMLDNVAAEMPSDPDYRSWVDEVLGEYKAFKGMTYDGVAAHLLHLLRSTSFRKLTAHDLDLRLQAHATIIERFFAVRVVTDLAQTEDLLRKVLGGYNLREVTDDEVRRLSERIGKPPPGSGSTWAFSRCSESIRRW